MKNDSDNLQSDKQEDKQIANYIDVWVDRTDVLYYHVLYFIQYIIYELYIYFCPTNYPLHPIPNLVCSVYLLIHNLYHFTVAPVFTRRFEIFFSQIRKMSFAGRVPCVVRSRMAQHFWLNLKDRKYIMDLHAEKKILLNRIIQQYVNSISVCAAVS